MAQATPLMEPLINATRVLAQGPEEQHAAFPEFVVLPDELAQNFADAFMLVDQLLEQGLMNREQARLFEAVDEELRSMTALGTEELWTIDALRHREEWQAVRWKARAALGALGADLGRAGLSGITYVRGGSS